MAAGHNIKVGTLCITTQCIDADHEGRIVEVVSGLRYVQLRGIPRRRFAYEVQFQSIATGTLPWFAFPHQLIQISDPDMDVSDTTRQPETVSQ